MGTAEMITLLAASVTAGVMNAIAGGGTILTFPLLLFWGTPPLIANATSTLALVAGTFGSIFGFRRQARQVRPWLILLTAPSLLGGWLGSFLLTRSEERFFEKLVPYLLLFASILFLVQGLVRKLAANQTAPCAAAPAHRAAAFGAVAFQFGVAIYGGYFGAGIGILMLACLGFMGMHDIHRMNAVKNILAAAINIVAAAWFVFADLIDWPRAALMSAGAFGGYFLGAHYSQKIPQRMVRFAVVLIGFGITATLFVRQLRGG